MTDRRKPVAIRMSDTERSTIANAAEEAGLMFSEYVRAQCIPDSETTNSIQGLNVRVEELWRQVSLLREEFDALSECESNTAKRVARIEELASGSYQ